MGYEPLSTRWSFFRGGRGGRVYFSLVLYFRVVFKKKIIPLQLVGYDDYRPNVPRWLSFISYPTRSLGIIVKYPTYAHEITAPTSIQRLSREWIIF